MIHGIVKVWATRFGLTLDEYLLLCKTKKRCQKCKTWKLHSMFPKDKSRYDSLNVRCFSCQRINRPPKWHILNESEKERLSKRNKENKWRKGIPLSKEHKELLRQCRIKEGQNGNGSFYGPNNPNWKGGITPEIKIARANAAYNKWRNAVFMRDNFTCQKCGDDKGGNLHAHHIKKFAEHKELRYIVKNGITLCFDCHAKVHDVPNSFRKRRAAARRKKL